MKLSIPGFTRPRSAPADQLIAQREASHRALALAEQAEQVALEAFDLDCTDQTEAALVVARGAVARAELHADRAVRLVAAAERQAAEAARAQLEAQLAALEAQLSPSAKARRRRKLEDEETLLLLRVVEVRHTRQTLEYTLREQDGELARVRAALGQPVPGVDLSPASFSPMVVIEQLEDFARTLPVGDERRHFVAELIDQLAPGRAFYVHRLAAAE